MKQPHNEYECARAWAALSAAHALVTERLSAELIRSCGVSINDFEVLLRLHRVPNGGLRVSDLKETVRLSQPAVSRMVARLEERGLISRDGDPSDGRGVVIALTGAGGRVLSKAVPVHAKVIRECLLDRLEADENEQLSLILDRIVQ